MNQESRYVWARNNIVVSLLVFAIILAPMAIGNYMVAASAANPEVVWQVDEDIIPTDTACNSLITDNLLHVTPDAAVYSFSTSIPVDLADWRSWNAYELSVNYTGEYTDSFWLKLNLIGGSSPVELRDVKDPYQQTMRFSLNALDLEAWETDGIDTLHIEVEYFDTGSEATDEMTLVIQLYGDKSGFNRFSVVSIVILIVGVITLFCGLLMHENIDLEDFIPKETLRKWRR